MSLSAAELSVIVPCRDAASTLAEALESVQAQTVRPLEILVIDDGSRDRSVRVARKFGAPVRVLTASQRGPGAARRLGVIQAKGRYIAWVDADDVLAPDKHEKQLAVLENASAWTVAHTGSTCFGADGGRSTAGIPDGAQAQGRCTRVIFESNPVCGASTMWRRSVLLELGNYDADMLGSEDYLMSLLASERCDFVYLDEPLYHRRRHAANVTNNRCLMAYFHWLAQDRFRRRCPRAFADIPDVCVDRAMVQPVLRIAKQAYWRRQSRDYPRLLRLAMSLAPDDGDLRMMWRRRAVPMSVLRMWDRLQWHRPLSAGEVT